MKDLITLPRAELQAALDALEITRPLSIETREKKNHHLKVIGALRSRLAEPAQDETVINYGGINDKPAQEQDEREAFDRMLLDCDGQFTVTSYAMFQKGYRAALKEAPSVADALKLKRYGITERFDWRDIRPDPSGAYVKFADVVEAGQARAALASRQVEESGSPFINDQPQIAPVLSDLETANKNAVDWVGYLDSLAVFSKWWELHYGEDNNGYEAAREAWKAALASRQEPATTVPEAMGRGALSLAGLQKYTSIISDWECNFIESDACVRELEKLLDAFFFIAASQKGKSNE